MNKIEELTEGMQQLCAVANRIVASGSKVNRIERDLLMDDLRNLYDIALRLCDDDATYADKKDAYNADMHSSTVMATMAAMSTPELEPVQESQVEEPAPQLSMEEVENSENTLLFDEVIIELEPAPELSPEPVLEPPLAPAPEPTSAPAPEPTSAPAPEPTPAPDPTPVSEPNPAHNERESDLLNFLKHPVSEHSTVRTLGERLGSYFAESEVHHKKIDDLRTAININDKFSFMSELFKNNMRAYNEFIMYLNGLTSRDEAMAHVKEISAQYKWDDGSSAVAQFWKIFDKKF